MARPFNFLALKTLKSDNKRFKYSYFMALFACQGAGGRLKRPYFAGGDWAFEGEILKIPPVESNL